MDYKKKTIANTETKVEEDVGKSKPQSGSKFKKVMMIMVGVGVTTVLVVALVMYSKSEKTPAPVEATGEVSNETTVVTGNAAEGDLSETVVEGGEDKPWLNASVGGDTAPVEETKPAGNKTAPSDKVTPGITDPSQNQYVKNYSDVEEDTFVKGLNGEKVAEHYEIGDIKTVVDFVSYKKKRATTAPGIELYWLEAQYKGKKAKIQLPFKIFKELDPVGVTVVDVEVTYIPNADTSKDPIEIVTGFTVREDYKQLLEQSNGNGGW